MTIALVPLADAPDAAEERTLDRIARFFGHHAGLVGVDDPMPRAEAAETLAEWQGEDHDIRLVVRDGVDVGFVHVWFKGPIVTWIEDLWIDEELRGQGLASTAIGLVEAWMVRDFPEVEAVSMDVAPRNADALRLYHRLGYDAVSLITLRKVVRGEDRRDGHLPLLGMDFRC